MTGDVGRVMAQYPDGGTPPTTFTSQPPLPRTGGDSNEASLAGFSAIALGVILLVAVAKLKAPKWMRRKS